MALVCALVREEGLADKVGWHLRCFGDPQAYAVELGKAPADVNTVVNCRVANRSVILAQVSGGVKANPAALVRRQAIEISRDGSLSQRRFGRRDEKAVGRQLVVGLNHADNHRVAGGPR